MMHYITFLLEMIKKGHVFATLSLVRAGLELIRPNPFCFLVWGGLAFTKDFVRKK